MITNWNILKVHTLRESTVAGNLRSSLGLKTYVPVEVIKKVRRGVKFERRHPLVPSYVFVKGAADVPMALIKRVAPFALEWLELGGRTATVTDAEIDLIDATAQEQTKRLANWCTFHAGERVRITEGPFMSIESLLKFVDEKRQVGTLELPLLGSKRSLTVPLGSIEKVA